MVGADVVAQIAEAAAGTIVATMANDAWSQARTKLTQILGGRGDLELIDGNGAANPELARHQLSQALLAILTSDAAVMEPLRQFVMEFDPGGQAVRLMALYGGTPREDLPGGFSIAPPLGRLGTAVRGRTQLISALGQLVGRPGAGVHVLHGLGGCGKSTVALAVADAAVQAGAHVWWISGVDATTVSSGMREVAATLGASSDLLQRAWSGRASAFDLVGRLLADCPQPWLLVMDNADDPQVLAPPGVPFAHGTGWIRPRTPSQGLVLITSRDGSSTGWGSWVSLHHVELLSEDDATQVLVDLGGNAPGTRPEAAALARRLGGLPLALHLAGTFLAASSVVPDWPGVRPIRTYAGYTLALGYQATTLLEEDPPGRQELVPGIRVSRVWELSLDLLERRSLPEARPLMRLLSAFGSAPVPYLRLLLPDLLAESRLFPGMDHARLTAALIGLADLGLIDLMRRADTVNIHPLVRDSSREQPDVAEHASEYLLLLGRLLEAATAQLSPVEPSDRRAWQLIQRHCDAPLGLFGTQGVPTHVLVPHLTAIDRALDYLLRVGSLDRADEMLTVAGAAVTLLDRTSTPVLGIRSRMAQAAAAHGRLAEAEDLLRSVVADTEHRFGAPSMETAQARYALALLLDERGLPKEARAAFSAVYREFSSVAGPDDPHTLAARRGIALTMRHLGSLAEAEAAYRHVLELQSAVAGRNHPDTLTTRHDLAQVLHERGQFSAAEQELREVAEGLQKLFGARHPATLAARKDLADVLRDRGRLAEAEKLVREVLQLCREVHGEDHPATLAARYGLAKVLRDRGWPADAEFAFREVLEVRRRMLGDEHPQTLAVRHTLADILLQRGLLAEAEAEFRAVYRARRASLGEQHLLTLSVRHGTALVLLLRGRPAQAEREYRAVLADCVTTLGGQHPGTLAVRHGLADLLLAQNRVAEAEAEFRAVYRARRASLGEQHLLTLSVRHGTALVLRLRGRPAEAEAEYRAVLADCITNLGEHHEGTLAVREGLADLVRELGRATEAREQYESLYRSALTVLGDTHPMTRRARSRLS